MLTVIYNTKSEKNNSLTIVLGNGLIGSAIIKSLKKQLTPVVENYIYPWHSAADQEVLLSKCSTKLSILIEQNPHIDNISFVWAAGKAGFYSSSEETVSELLTFKRILHWSEKFRDSLNRKHGDVKFIMLSSAGGLYEGISFINSHTPVSIKRPYGELKLNQENALINSSIINKKIIRPSSVYGYCNPNQRMGLIPTMINNCLKYKVTNIFGNLDTLRDYIWIEDLCNYIAQTLIQREKNKKDQIIEIVASGKPTSIYEIIIKIENQLRRKMQLSFKESKNALDITFAKSTLPPGLHPQDLDTIVSKIIKNCFF